MPWRAQINDKPNPYHILVSEFMLQQTTVQTVIPYFERFIDRFPTLELLAAASLDDVYTLWQGLGYYSRAKNLHLSAQQICDIDYFPTEIEILKTLAGIGPYTSAAIAAIAFDQPTMPVDGNVMRVMSRLFAFDDPKGPKLNEKSNEAVKIFAGKQDNTHSAQALMELGAIVCKPKNPQCDQCPLNSECIAFQTISTHKYPILIAKTEKPKRIATTYVIQNRAGQILITKRPEKGLFANMYIFPTTCFDFDPLLLLNLTQLIDQKKTIKHVFSHFELKLTIVHAKALDATQGLWVEPLALSAYAMPTLMHKVIKNK
jgi:A/G-specific adenine glycosylase